MQNESIMDERNENTQVYEVSFIFDNRLDETTATAKSVALKELIASLGGSFISEEAPYKRELAYEMIRVVSNVNVRFNEGYFGWVKFELDRASVAAIDKNLKLDEEVVRYMIIKSEVGNDIMTKDKTVFKSYNEVMTFKPAAEVSGEASVNIDTTTTEEVSETLAAEVAPVAEA